MNRDVYIYTLAHPITSEIRYVGRTFNLKKRVENHIERAKMHKANRYICDWIKSLLKNNLKPIISEVEKSDTENWVAREKYWISYYRSLGCNLCNLSDGGESNDGYKATEETKRIQSARQRERHAIRPASKETKEAISKTLSRPVICSEGNIYPSAKMAIKETGIPKTTFHRKLNNGEQINGKTFKHYNKQKESK